MNEPRTAEPWSPTRFLRWQEGEDALHELVDGFPLKLPEDVTRRHDRLAVALIGWLGTALRGTRYVPFTRRFAVETRPGQIRRPAVGVDAGATAPEAWIASEPIAVFEIVTDLLRDFNRLRKIADYQRAPFLRHIVFCDEASPRAVHWSRLTGAGWDEASVEGLDAVLPLTGLGVTLPLRALYASALV
ncbi:Uma2 family endonuclease [Aureimonas ureilytica]|uniref:Uma2 family endonuclease n=1 Tax=Aureimonas ureilytica TaxID=401562 RepID=UPI000372C908|nr:Uma2 family endonuclease [Aureimonas ureilytica]